MHKYSSTRLIPKVASLIGFIMPHLFYHHKKHTSKFQPHETLSNNQRIGNEAFSCMYVTGVTAKEARKVTLVLVASSSMTLCKKPTKKPTNLAFFVLVFL